ncbi:hypothetical protein E2562_032769 [Oryza meyeriana var. granulata]|uniref:Uncharacterized protein n=1 Tax=Oryza meyeriana var. granulata TaxID=110450 RepID=A0A6G1F0I5_9ORYZ|nr:hypothetical protein E2562_032769 [Oryza meyeriana var. granulata]
MVDRMWWEWRKSIPSSKPHPKCMTSAWLNNSNDSVKGNDKKGNTFWWDITAEFNNNTATIVKGTLIN